MVKKNVFDTMLNNDTLENLLSYPPRSYYLGADTALEEAPVNTLAEEKTKLSDGNPDYLSIADTLFNNSMYAKDLRDILTENDTLKDKKDCISDYLLYMVFFDDLMDDNFSVVDQVPDITDAILTVSSV